MSGVQYTLQRFGLVLPHEIFFGLLSLGVIASLLVSGVQDATALLLFFASCLAVEILLVAFCRLKPTSTRWRLRLLFYPLIINPVYPVLPEVVAALGRALQDEALQRIDRLLIGGDLSVRLQPLATPLLTEVLSGAYLFYMIYFGVSQLLYFLDELELAVRFYIGLFTVFFVGFIGYVLVPAHGPYIALSESFATPLVGGAITRFNQEVVRLGSIRVDVFPSLHCAVPAFILAFDYRHKRARFWLCLGPCLLLFASTIYLRYHYLIDVVAGFGLALVAFLLATRWAAAEAPSSPIPALERTRSGRR